MLEIIMCPIFVQLVFQASRSNSGPKSRKWIHKKVGKKMPELGPLYIHHYNGNYCQNKIDSF